jgi:hypothetical protein
VRRRGYHLRLPNRTVPVGHLEQCGDERTTLEVRPGEPFSEDLEDGQQTLHWSVAPALGFGLHPTVRPENLAALKEGEDEIVLGREVPV